MLVLLGLLAMTILLMVIMAVYLLNGLAASKLLDMVGLLNLCIEKERFITNFCLSLYVICVMHLMQQCVFMNTGCCVHMPLVNRKGVRRLPIKI